MHTNIHLIKRNKTTNKHSIDWRGEEAVCHSIILVTGVIASFMLITIACSQDFGGSFFFVACKTAFFLEFHSTILKPNLRRRTTCRIRRILFFSHRLTFTCFSVKPRQAAISIRRNRERYILAENSRSNSNS